MLTDINVCACAHTHTHIDRCTPTHTSTRAHTCTHVHVTPHATHMDTTKMHALLVIIWWKREEGNNEPAGRREEMGSQVWSKREKRNACQRELEISRWQVRCIDRILPPGFYCPSSEQRRSKTAKRVRSRVEMKQLSGVEELYQREWAVRSLNHSTSLFSVGGFELQHVSNFRRWTAVWVSQSQHATVFRGQAEACIAARLVFIRWAAVWATVCVCFQRWAEAWTATYFIFTKWTAVWATVCVCFQRVPWRGIVLWILKKPRSLDWLTPSWNIPHCWIKRKRAVNKWSKWKHVCMWNDSLCLERMVGVCEF